MDGKRHSDSPNIRKGQFLWKDSSERQKYLDTLRRRIREGYFFRDRIMTRIADEIAPVLNENLDHIVSSR